VPPAWSGPARTRDRDLPQVRLYTHEIMTENVAIYRAPGYSETAPASARVCVSG